MKTLSKISLATSTTLLLLVCACAVSANAKDNLEKTAGDIKIVEEVLQLAEKGDAKAQFYLGQLYAQGAGVPSDGAKAVKWMRKSAEQGYAEAEYNFGYMYAHGNGVKKDEKKAVEWFRRAAKQNYPPAQHSLGVAYLLGVGVQDDPVEAARWFHLAAEQGFASSQHNLFTMYSDDRGIPQNDVEAIKWLKRAAEQGEASAQYDFGMALSIGSNGLRRNYVMAYAWCGAAAAGGADEATACYRAAETKLSDSERERARELTAEFRKKHVRADKPTAVSAGALKQLIQKSSKPEPSIFRPN